MPEHSPDERVSLARAALAAATADARARGVRPASAPPRAAARAEGSPVDATDVRTGTDAADTQAAVSLPGETTHQPSDQAESGPVPGLGPVGTTPAVARRGGRRLAGRPGFMSQSEPAEPQPLGAAINSLVDAEGWGLAAATGSVFGRWAQIVGSDLAAHTTPESMSDGELTVSADSTAWATQVRLLAGQLVRRLNIELGDGTVRRVRVRGPVTSTRKPGQWRVRGGRGPRDTYG
ncbi:MAG TPA: DciA family protein [Streptosporangiaceae bacterium]|nr:DciA family protein [Streptosporangiaceae bacterium]